MSREDKGPEGSPGRDSEPIDASRIVLKYLEEFEQQEAGTSRTTQEWTVKKKSTVPQLETVEMDPSTSHDGDGSVGISVAPDAVPGEKTTDEFEFVEPSKKPSSATEGIGGDEESLNIGDRYRIVSGLGMGGMGSVFKVQHRRLGKTFALKIINPVMSAESKMQRLFYREAQVLSALDHPNIVAVTDFGTDDRFGTFLVMEYLHGESLHSRIVRQQRLALGPSLQIALQVARALHYMHQRELVHCDIKAENIFLCRYPDGEGRRISAKLIDFGLARKSSGETQLASSEIGGTPVYSPPEQIGGAAPQPTMDIYAVGVLLFESLTGQALFHGSLDDIFDQKSNESFPLLSEVLAEDVDPRLDSLIARTLRSDPGKRHPNMGSLIYELRTLMEMLGLHTARGSRGLRPTRRQLEREPGADATAATSPPLAAPSLSESVKQCPVPLFLLDSDGCLLTASKGFCALAQESGDALQGRTLGTTRLAHIYPEIDLDVGEVVSQRQPVQRTVQFVTGEKADATLVFRLVPWRDRAKSPVLVWGNAMPLQ